YLSFTVHLKGEHIACHDINGTCISGRVIQTASGRHLRDIETVVARLRGRATANKFDLGITGSSLLCKQGRDVVRVLTPLLLKLLAVELKLTSTPVRTEPNIRQTSDIRVFQAGDNMSQYLAKLTLNVSNRRIASQNAAVSSFAVVGRQISNGLLQLIKLVNEGLNTLGNGSSILLNLNGGFTRFGE